MTNDEFDILKLQLSSIQTMCEVQKEYIAISNRITEITIDCLERAITIFNNVEKDTK